LALRPRKPAKKALATAKKKRKNPEKGLQYRCQQWLEKSGWVHRLLIFHVANERKGGIGAILHFKRMGVLPGVGDYLAFRHAGDQLPRPAAAIELKDKDSGKQDKEQEAFQKRWEACGNRYFLVRTLEDFQNVVQAFALFG